MTSDEKEPAAAKEQKVFFYHLNVDNPHALHPVYKELVLHPPKGFSFSNKADLIGRNYDKQRKSGKKPWYSVLVPLLRTVKNQIGLPVVIRKDAAADLIHSGQALLSTKNAWVIDFEIITSLAGFEPAVARSRTFRRVLKRYLEAENCKAILPWSHAAAQSLFTILDTPAIRKKTHVVYPAISIEDAQAAKKKGSAKKGKGLTFLFVSRFFARKGGYEALSAFRKVHKIYPHSKLIMVGDIPAAVKSRSIPDVTFLGTMPREKLYNEVFAKGDIFLYPTFFDTFGLVVLEAMAFGMPCITLDDFATAELVDDGKDGFLIDGYTYRQIGKDGIHIKRYQDPELLMELNKDERARTVTEIADRMIRFIKDETLLKRCSQAASKKMSEGMFSIKRRNTALEKIYGDACANR